MLYHGKGHRVTDAPSFAGLHHPWSVTMAVAHSHRGAPLEGVDPRFDVSAGFMRFFGAMCTVSTVSRIGIADGDDCLDIWIRLGDDDESEEEKIYGHLQDYRFRRERPSVDLHVIGSEEGPNLFPRDVAIVFDRA